jgi:hypothetical protein
MGFAMQLVRAEITFYVAATRLGFWSLDAHLFWQVAFYLQTGFM